MSRVLFLDDAGHDQRRMPYAVCPGIAIEDPPTLAGRDN